MSTVRLRYRGTGTKVVPLPCPLLSKSEQTGEVVCDPIGEFPEDAARHLLSCGDLFEALDPLPWEQNDQAREDDWTEDGPVSALPPKDKPVAAFSSKGIATMHAKRRGLVVRENPESETPYELWAPSPTESEGAPDKHAISA